ncbi:MAG: ABC transporter ATP-binding protein [Deltaproteobacteria bacterium]|nr:ABC transporter ATP-binding protein [Deltaproteobacteria bacterium]MDO9211813.1 ABC transporter ATP-binding protein [Deltaproteobacteria bacterium]
MNGRNVIETQELTKVYGEQVAVDHLNLKINEGEVFGFLGPNGAGKTTTLLMLLGLSEPTSGKAWVCGFDPTREPLKVKRLVGYLAENVGFYDDMNAVQNLLFISRLNGIPDDLASNKIKELLKIVDLEVDPKKKVGEYSRGMRQRLGIAEVLLKDPQVVFLDEPTLGLDPDGSIQMLELIRSLSQDKKITVFFCSHLLDQVQKISHRVGIMIKGHLVAVGRIEDLAKEKFGVGPESYTLEEVYMKYFKEG